MTKNQTMLYLMISMLLLQLPLPCFAMFAGDDEEDNKAIVTVQNRINNYKNSAINLNNSLVEADNLIKHLLGRISLLVLNPINSSIRELPITHDISTETIGGITKKDIEAALQNHRLREQNKKKEQINHPVEQPKRQQATPIMVNKSTAKVEKSLDDDKITNIPHYAVAIKQEEEGQHDLANYNYYVAFEKETNTDFCSSSNVSEAPLETKIIIGSSESIGNKDDDNTDEGVFVKSTLKNKLKTITISFRESDSFPQWGIDTGYPAGKEYFRFGEAISSYDDNKYRRVKARNLYINSGRRYSKLADEVRSLLRDDIKDVDVDFVDISLARHLIVIKESIDSFEDGNHKKIEISVYPSLTGNAYQGINREVVEAAKKSLESFKNEREERLEKQNKKNKKEPHKFLNEKDAQEMQRKRQKEEDKIESMGPASFHFIEGWKNSQSKEDRL